VSAFCFGSCLTWLQCDETHPTCESAFQL
jgi:hypothetical protein